MKFLFSGIVFFVLRCGFTQAYGLYDRYEDKPTRDSYEQAFHYLNQMLVGDTSVSFKNAVYTVENTYLNGKLDYDTFNVFISHYAHTSAKFAAKSNLLYEGPDKTNMQKLGSVFMIMTATEPLFLDSTHYLRPNPFTYDFDDFWGDRDWTKMFVSKLLATQKGNCHSLPYLYKIIADEIDARCYLSFAPNHTYIKARSMNPKVGWFNTELTNATFPIDAWIKSSGYVHLNAIRNGLYMDTLSAKQEIAVCMIDLAKGHERLFRSKQDTEFILRCANTALLYYPNYINAMLLKAETLKKQFEHKMEELQVAYPKQAFKDPVAKSIFEEMEPLYAKIFRLGYRTMPKEMYVKWLADLKDHKEKYLNKDLIHNLTQPNQTR
ncbi:MAG: hypothetical protein AAF551_04015 [Bacteroidota bacterium]